MKDSDTGQWDLNAAPVNSKLTGCSTFKTSTARSLFPFICKIRIKITFHSELSSGLSAIMDFKVVKSMLCKYEDYCCLLGGEMLRPFHTRWAIS